MPDIVETPVAAEVPVVKLNVFDKLAFLVLVVRLSLEGKSPGSGLPRYVRILKIREVDPPDEFTRTVTNGIESVVGTVSEGLIIAVNKLIDITLSARDILSSTDSLIAQAEVSLKLVKEIIDNNFIDQLARGITLNMANLQGFLVIPPNIADLIGEKIDKIENVLDQIPRPEDLALLGHELYRLACVIHHPKTSTDPLNKMDIDSTGKVRILQYGFDKKWEVFEVPCQHLGKRSLAAPLISEKVRIDGNLLFDIGLPAPSRSDEENAKAILAKLLYTNSNLAINIKEFQIVNGLEVTQTLDNATVNRLFNLDTKNLNLKRALKRPDPMPLYDVTTKDFLPLVNPNAETPKEDWHTGGTYKYYIITPIAFVDENNMSNVGDGWRRIRASNDFVNGFVGLESRRYAQNADPRNIYHGDWCTEGESHSPRHFFAARVTQPDVSGRAGAPEWTIYSSKTFIPEPETGPLISGPTNKISRMMQLVKVPDVVVANLDKPAYESIKFTASAYVRSLFNDKSKSPIDNQKLPDQCRVSLQLFTLVNNELVQVDEDKNSEWYPDTSWLSKAEIEEKAIEYKNFWKQWFSESIVLKKADVKGKQMYAKVILEGRQRSGWDIDAYFDDVAIEWEYIKTSTAG